MPAKKSKANPVDITKGPMHSGPAEESKTPDGSKQPAEERLRTPTPANEALRTEIGRRTRAEAELKRQRHDLRIILSGQTDIITRTDRHLRYTFVSPHLERILGLPQHEFVGKTPREMRLFDEATASRVEKQSQLVLATGKITTLQFTNHSNGRARHFSIRIIPEFDVRGEVAGLLRVTQDITELRRTERSLRATKRALLQRERDLAEVAGKILNAEEDERRRVARALHDEFTQRLASLAIEMGRLGQEVPSSSAAALKISDLQDQINQFSMEVHRLSRRLHPSILDNLGLIKAIEAECRELRQNNGLEVTFVWRGIPDPILSNTALCLYRIVQEGLKNIAKHAETDKAHVLLLGRGGLIRLCIQDEGIGFDPARAKGRGGLGLASMEERARIMRGKISVRSVPGQGTSITVRAPAEPKTT